MEDNQLQLKQLPCVGQEIDVDTYQSFSCKMIRSGMFEKITFNCLNVKLSDLKKRNAEEGK
jgi:hypothetical protein